MFHLVDRVLDFHMCPKLKLGRSIVGVEREWGAKFGKKKLTGKGLLKVMLQLG